MRSKVLSMPGTRREVLYRGGLPTSYRVWSSYTRHGYSEIIYSSASRDDRDAYADFLMLTGRGFGWLEDVNPEPATSPAVEKGE